MHLIPAGEFTMGSTREQTEAAKAMDKAGPQFPLLHETPQFRTYIDNFYLSAFMVTNEQFAHFLTETEPSPQQLRLWVPWLDRIVPSVEEGSYSALPEFKSHPVINVTWFDVEAYCQWAGLRLPTEIEWEKAARGNDGRIFQWGKDWQPDHLCWWGSHDKKESTVPVDAFPQGCSLHGISKWPATSRNGAPIGISWMFTSVMPREISRCRALEWAGSFAAAIVSAKTNSNSAAQCGVQTHLHLQISCLPVSVAPQIDTRSRLPRIDNVTRLQDAIPWPPGL